MTAGLDDSNLHKREWHEFYGLDCSEKITPVLYFLAFAL